MWCCRLWSFSYVCSYVTPYRRGGGGTSVVGAEARRSDLTKSNEGHWESQFDSIKEKKIDRSLDLRGCWREPLANGRTQSCLIWNWNRTADKYVTNSSGLFGTIQGSWRNFSFIFLLEKANSNTGTHCDLMMDWSQTFTVKTQEYFQPRLDMGKCDSLQKSTINKKK